MTSFYMLVLFNIVFMLISNFNAIQLSMFSVNLVISSIVVGWRMAIIMIAASVVIILSLWDSFFSGYNIDFSVSSPGFVCAYIMMLIGTTLVIFIKPRQEQYDLSEERGEHLASRIGVQEEQTRKALELKGQFIRNIQHEYNTPMTGILSMADALKGAYYHLDDKRRLEAIDDILQSAGELKIYDENLQTLAKLSGKDYKLRKEDLDFSDLVYDRTETCRKLYEKNRDDREFILEIQEGISLNGDRHYLTQVLDNLIINAITYSENGKITIALKQQGGAVEFSIADEGIGIPPEELTSIFEEFVVSSRTHTFAGGRGVGLALAKKVVEVHGGAIKAESDGVKGAKFGFVLPLKSRV